eukprot:SAG11_NODE_224_length_12103_cov_8.087054_7_plen_88_part_00
MMRVPGDVAIGRWDELCCKNARLCVHVFWLSLVKQKLFHESYDVLQPVLLHSAPVLRSEGAVLQAESMAWSHGGDALAMCFGTDPSC